MGTVSSDCDLWVVICNSSIFKRILNYSIGYNTLKDLLILSVSFVSLAIYFFVFPSKYFTLYECCLE